MVKSSVGFAGAFGEFYSLSLGTFTVMVEVGRQACFQKKTGKYGVNKKPKWMHSKIKLKAGMIVMSNKNRIVN